MTLAVNRKTELLLQSVYCLHILLCCEIMMLREYLPYPKLNNK